MTARHAIALAIERGWIVPSSVTVPPAPNTFKTTPGPRQGVRYVSPYRHVCKRKP